MPRTGMSADLPGSIAAPFQASESGDCRDHRARWAADMRALPASVFGPVLRPP